MLIGSIWGWCTWYSLFPFFVFDYLIYLIIKPENFNQAYSPLI